MNSFLKIFFSHYYTQSQKSNEVLENERDKEDEVSEQFILSYLDSNSLWCGSGRLHVIYDSDAGDIWQIIIIIIMWRACERERWRYTGSNNYENIVEVFREGVMLGWSSQCGEVLSNCFNNPYSHLQDTPSKDVQYKEHFADYSNRCSALGRPTRDVNR